MPAKTKQYVKRGERLIDRLGQQMDRETQADYRITRSAGRAAAANLARQTNRINTQSDRLVAKNQDALNRIVERAAAGRRSTKAAESKAADLYGSAMSGQIGQQFAVAGATARAGAQQAQAAQVAGQGAMKTQDTVTKIGNQGVAAVNAAARYAYNQALASRNAITAETLANLEGNLYQSAMQYQMQWDMWKKQQQYAQKQADKQQVAQTRATVDYLTNQGGDIQAWAANPDNYVKGDDGQIDVGATVQAYAKAYGLDPSINPQDQTALAVMKGTLAGIRNGQSADAAMSNTVDTLYGSMPGWDRLGGSVMSSISASAGVAQTSQQAQSIAASTGTDPINNPNDRDAFLSAYRQQYGDVAAAQWATQNLGWSQAAAEGYISTMPGGGFSWTGQGYGAIIPLTNPYEHYQGAYGTYAPQSQPGAPASTGTTGGGRQNRSAPGS